MMNLICRILFALMSFVSRGDMSPEYYFSSWEVSNVPGMFFLVDDYYLIFARGEAAALHEVGHIADAERGYISQTPEFEQAVIEYLDYCVENPCHRINYYYGYGQLDEIYAVFYMWNILYSIPQEFEEFYER